VLAEIRQRFQSFGVTMPERNSRQAMVIENAEVLPNPNGTAPGMFMDHHGTAIVLLPGPPREMRPMFENHVVERLAGRAGSLRVVRRMLRVAGMGESAVDEKIAPVYTQYDNPVTTILFNKSEIEIHLTARGRTEKEANDLLDRLSAQIEERLGNAIFSFAGETMEEVVGLKLALGGYTLAVAESCTGGNIAHLITTVPGSSKYFKGTVVSYANEAKENVLHVNHDTLMNAGAVSEETVKEMVSGVLNTMNTDYALATSGIMGPDGGSEEKPVGTVWLAAGNKEKTETLKLNLRFDRVRNIEQTSLTAMNFLRKFIINNG